MEAIYAIDIHNGLAKNGTIPWHSKKDLKFFKEKTKNNVIIMGKSTFLSLPNGYLKDRLNIILTRHPETIDVKNNSFVMITSADYIYKLILQDREKWKKSFPYLNENFSIFFIGGKQIYEQFVPLCDKIWVTKIKKDYDCDLFFHYDYSLQFNEEIIEENEELQIINYSKA
uniref:dihydrofolate reductase n=1 Tax=viral metagenome TaxID=1070528 RepID=A0A6C0JLD7_9ZZZZ